MLPVFSVFASLVRIGDPYCPQPRSSSISAPVALSNCQALHVMIRSVIADTDNFIGIAPPPSILATTSPTFKFSNPVIVISTDSQGSTLLIQAKCSFGTDDLPIRSNRIMRIKMLIVWCI
jgi:hypothetical protein